MLFWLGLNACILIDFIFQLPSFTGLTVKCPFIRVNGGYSTISGVYKRSIEYADDEPDNPVWEHSEGYDRYIFKFNWFWRIGNNASLSTGEYFFKSKIIFSM